MSPLLVVPEPPTTPSVSDGAPALAALSELIRLGDALPPDDDWRSGMLRDLRADALASAAPAQIAALALPLPAGSGVCLATPVHVVAGMSRVHLHSAGVLALLPAERDWLQSEFAGRFGPEACLHGNGDGWVLAAPWAVAADDGDPMEWRGMPLSREPARSPEQRNLRRAGAELEMWLAGMDWNMKRERSGMLPANLLWLWGGGRVLERQKVPTLQGLRLSAAHVDCWLAGVAALTGSQVQHLPAAWSRECGAPGSVTLLTSRADTGPVQWQEWEQRWFAPVLQELQAARMTTLSLRIGRRSWLVRRERWRRLLRRPSPWWQAVQA